MLPAKSVMALLMRSEPVSSRRAARSSSEMRAMFSATVFAGDVLEEGRRGGSGSTIYSHILLSCSSRAVCAGVASSSLTEH